LHRQYESFSKHDKSVTLRFELFGDIESSRKMKALSIPQVVEIFKMKDVGKKGRMATKIAKSYNVSSKAVRDIWGGRTWPLVTRHLRSQGIENSSFPPRARSECPGADTGPNCSSDCVSYMQSCEVKCHLNLSDGDNESITDSPADKLLICLDPSLPKQLKMEPACSPAETMSIGNSFATRDYGASKVDTPSLPTEQASLATEQHLSSQDHPIDVRRTHKPSACTWPGLMDLEGWVVPPVPWFAGL